MFTPFVQRFRRAYHRFNIKVTRSGPRDKCRDALKRAREKDATFFVLQRPRHRWFATLRQRESFGGHRKFTPGYKLHERNQ